MKSKKTAGEKKPAVVVQDLKAKKNPKGGSVILKFVVRPSTSPTNPNPSQGL